MNIIVLSEVNAQLVELAKSDIDTTYIGENWHGQFQDIPNKLTIWNENTSIKNIQITYRFDISAPMGAKFCSSK